MTEYSQWETRQGFLSFCVKSKVYIQFIFLLSVLKNIFVRFQASKLKSTCLEEKFNRHGRVLNIDCFQEIPLKKSVPTIHSHIESPTDNWKHKVLVFREIFLQKVQQQRITE